MKTNQTRSRSKTSPCTQAQLNQSQKKGETTQVLLRLQHPLFVWMKPSFLCRFPKMSKFFVPPPRWSIIPSLWVSFFTTVPGLSTRRKLADGEWRGAEHFGRKVCESQQYAPLPPLSAVVCLCRTASVRKKGKKNSASRHTREKPAPWHSNQLTRFVIIIGPRKPKGGCWEVFRGVAPPEYALSLFFPLMLMMVMFECRYLCFLFFSPHFFCLSVSVSHF